MSHVAQVNAVLKSLDIIEAAAQRLGGKLVRDQHKYRMYASGFVDDSTDWKTMFSPEEGARIERLSKEERVKIINKAMSYADHVITFPGASYDVGVIQQNDGTYRLRWDYYGQGGLPKYMGDRQAGKFVQAYGIEATKRAAQRKGYGVRESSKSDGTVQLELLVR